MQITLSERELEILEQALSEYINESEANADDTEDDEFRSEMTNDANDAQALLNRICLT